MSSIATTPRLASMPAKQSPSVTHLTAIELRKMSDTRAGWWLELGVLTVMVITVAATCIAGHPNQRTFQHILSNALIPAAILLPVIGTLLVTSEWSQRTTLSTFTLVPQRSRVLVAKLFAATAASLVPFAFGVAISAAGAAISSSGVHDVGTVHGAVLAQSLMYVSTNMIMGLAFGAALLASAPAIVAQFALPTAIAGLTSAIGKNSFLAWIDNTTLAPMTQHSLGATQWGRIATTLAVCMASAPARDRRVARPAKRDQIAHNLRSRHRTAGSQALSC